VPRLLHGQLVPERQLISNAAITAVLAQGVPTYITEPLLHILLQPHISHVAQAFMPQLRVLKKGRYLRRWARRLREAGIFPEGDWSGPLARGPVNEGGTWAAQSALHHKSLYRDTDSLAPDDPRRDPSGL